MSEQEPGPTHTPYGQPSGQSDPYGQSNPYGQPQAGQPSPYGQQQYGQQPSGEPSGERRPGTVTAAAWIGIVFSAIVAAVFGFTVLALIVARDDVIAEMEKYPEFQDANIDPDAAVGVLVAVILGFVLWSVIAIVLSVLVLRRSGVARILLVISASVTALLSLLTITSGISLVVLIAAAATIVLLFVGGAGAWFNRTPAYVGGQPYGGYTQQYPSPGQYGAPNPYGDPYGQPPVGGQDSAPQYPPPSENPYGQPPAQGGQEGGSDHPPKDYRGR